MSIADFMTRYPHPERILTPTRECQPRMMLDCTAFKPVVFESDDWGVGEPGNGLESVENLENLYQILESVRGYDGQPAVFTGFSCMSNPDFAAIRANGFSRFVDYGPDPEAAVTRKWREGIGRGVFFPEYHSNLHHTSPVVWMDLLRGTGPDADAVRKLFDRRHFATGVHIPEFMGMNLREMNHWIRTGVERFATAVGYPAAVAVTSDAYPATEWLWALNGIRTVALKNCMNNRGECVVYHTKPWNNQSPWFPMGGYDDFTDLVYLSRNVFFEAGNQEEPEQIANLICQRWQENVPAVISCHRPMKPNHLARIRSLLANLAQNSGVRFVTSAELGDLYRQGWSTRRHSRGLLLRQWAGQATIPALDGAFTHLVSLPDERDFTGHLGKPLNLPAGDYLAIRA